MPGEGSPFDVPPAAFGRYRVLHHIGAGSLGPVFRGEDPDSGHAVVINVLRVNVSAERAHQIADALAALGGRLPSQGVVAGIVAAGLHRGDPYYVTRLVPGDSLDAALREYGPAAMVDALPRLRALAHALDAAAGFGIWHGALQPRDIIVSAEDTALVGLGVAPLLEQAGIKLPVRTPYTAPEIIEGHKSSSASDQFALAAIAYEWLFGQRITGPADTVVALPALAGIDDEKVAAAFTSALALRPADRFASSTEFVATVSAAAHDTAVDRFATGLVAPEASGLAPSLVALDDEGITGGPQELTFDVPSASPEPQTAELRLTGEPDEPDEAAPPPPFWQGTLGVPVDMTVEASGRFGTGALALALCAGLAVGMTAGYWLGISGAGPRTARVADPAGREYTDAPVAVSSAPAAAPAPAVVPNPTGSPTAVRDQELAPPAVTTAGRSAPPADRPAAPTPDTGPVDSRPLAQGTEGRAVAPVAPGRILVRTTPAGADVTIDGVARGETPVAVRDLDLGTHTVVIARDGYASIERRVTLTADRPSRSIEERLAAPRAVSASPPASGETGVLQIESRPVGASVMVDGRPMGATPLTLPALSPGTYTVRIERAGYRPWSTTVQITSGQRARVAASLVGGPSQE